MYRLLLKYQGQCVFSSVCLSKLYFWTAVFDLCLIFFCQPGNLEPSLATYHYIIQLFYHHGMYDVMY